LTSYLAGLIARAAFAWEGWTTDDLLDHKDFPADLKPALLLVVAGAETSFV